MQGRQQREFTGCLAHFGGRLSGGKRDAILGKFPAKKKFGARLVLTLVEVLWEKYTESWGRRDLRGIKRIYVGERDANGLARGRQKLG